MFNDIIDIQQFLNKKGSYEMKELIKHINVMYSNSGMKSLFWELIEILFVQNDDKTNDKILNHWIREYIYANISQETDNFLKAIFLYDVNKINKFLEYSPSSNAILKYLNMNSAQELKKLEIPPEFRDKYLNYQNCEAIRSEHIWDLFRHNIRPILPYIKDPIISLHLYFRFSSFDHDVNKFKEVIDTLPSEIKPNSCLAIMIYYVKRDIENLLESLNPEEALLTFHFLSQISDLKLNRGLEYYNINLISRCCSYYIHKKKWCYAYFLYTFFNYTNEASKVLNRNAKPTLSLDRNEEILITHYNVDENKIYNAKARSVVYHSSLLEKEQEILEYLRIGLMLARDPVLILDIFLKQFLPLFFRISKDFNYLAKVIDQVKLLNDSVHDNNSNLGVVRDIYNLVSNNLEEVKPENFVRELKKSDNFSMKRDICILAMQKDIKFFDYLKDEIDACPKFRYNLNI